MSTQPKIHDGPVKLIKVESARSRSPLVDAVEPADRGLTPVGSVPKDLLAIGDIDGPAGRMSSLDIREKEPNATPVFPKSLEMVADHEIAEKLYSNKEERELPEGHIECPFKMFGCDFAGAIVHVQKHIRDGKMLHLSQMCDNVLTLQREVQVEIDKASKYLALDDVLKRRTSANDKLYSCQLIWRIDDYSKMFKQARNGDKNLLFSRPFYSHCNGYKLVCMLAPYGDGDALREFVSVFISIARGDNDGMLPWPYRCPVTFTLLNQKGAENVTSTLVPKPLPANEPFLGRPTADRNPAFGLQKFIKLDDMRNGKNFVVYDTCFLKIDVDVSEMSAN